MAFACLPLFFMVIIWGLEFWCCGTLLKHGVFLSFVSAYVLFKEFILHSHCVLKNVTVLPTTAVSEVRGMKMHNTIEKRYSVH